MTKKRRTSLFLGCLLAGFLLFTACDNGRKSNRRDATTDTIALQACPRFEADSAMQYIVEQCEFGPRVPGSEAWDRCSQWIQSRFKRMGIDVEVQSTEVTAWDGTKLPCRNIIARINPSASDRLLLCAHWDCRPWADNDPDEQNHHKPILAANDAASGVAMLIELARQIVADGTLKTGIDLVCFDVEDYGAPQWAEGEEDTSDTWCLGSQYWSRQAAENGYKARFGILFDMVGGRGATFSMEGFSRHYADPIVLMLWHLARQIGYSHYFPLTDGGFVTDDHVPVNQIAHVPTIDIIPHHEDGPSSFGPTWHTLSDTPENIDPNVLEAVGQSVLQLIYNDNAE